MSESEDEVFVRSQRLRFSDIVGPVLPSPSGGAPSGSSRVRAAAPPTASPMSEANSAAQSQLERVKSLVECPDHRGVLVSMQSARDALEHLQVRLLCILFACVAPLSDCFVFGLFSYSVPFLLQSLRTLKPGERPWFPGVIGGRGRGNNTSRFLFLRSIKSKHYSVATRDDGTVHLRRNQSAARVDRMIGATSREVNLPL